MLKNLLANKHTSAAGAIYLIAKVICPILAVWFPVHKAQLDQSSNLVEGFAVTYGLLFAGDASQGTKEVNALADKTVQAISTGNTDVLKKDVTTQ